MSTYKDGNYLTEKGRALIAKLMASQTEIEFTRATVGSGSIPEGSSPKEMTELAKYEVDGVLSDISVTNPGEVQIVFQVFSRDVSVGFLASEAAIWARDPDDGEILYTYVVMDNSPEFIRASNDPVQKFAEFTCINIVGSVEADLTVINPDAIATKRVTDAIQKELDEIAPLAKNAASGMTGRITIPASGWGESPEDAPKMPHYIDVALNGVTEDMTPIVTVLPESMDCAYEICLSSTALCGKDFIRFYAEAVPEEAINAQILIIATGADISGGSVHYVLPTATATRLGGVKIGNGVAVADDGTISINAASILSDNDIVATDDEVTEVIK